MSPLVHSRLATTSLLLLVFLCVASELWLAPLRPGGSWLVLKALPLLAPLPGVLAGRRYTYQWVAMLVLAYLAEGIVRGITESGISAAVAGSEVLFSLAFYGSAIAYVRTTRIRA